MIRPAGRRPGSSSRATTALIGFVLLVGMVAAVSVGIFLAADESLSQSEQNAETERIQQAFVELGHSMASASVDKDGARTVNFDAGESGAVTKTEAGWIHIEGGDIDANRTIGAIEYESDDGTIISYQSGGVWRETGNRTQMLSAPSLNYNHDTETLTFPITTVSGEQDLSSGEVYVRHHETDPMHAADVVEHDTVTVTVQSDYYRGWEAYFANQAGPTVVRDVDHDARIVTVELGHLELDDAFNSGITVSEGSGSRGNVDTDADSATRGSFREMDETIHRLIEDFEDDGDVEALGTVDGTEGPLTNGTYLADEVDLQEDLTVDLSDGNATLVVNGSVSVTNSSNLTVENWMGGETNNSLKVYVVDDLYINNGEMSVEAIGGEPNSQRLQVYGTSTTHVGMRNAIYEGTIFAPSTDFYSEEHLITGACSDRPQDGVVAQVCMRPSITFDGSIIGHSTYVQGGIGNVDFDYDEALQDAPIDPYPDGYEPPPQITYLNVAVHELDVENE